MIYMFTDEEKSGEALERLEGKLKFLYDKANELRDKRIKEKDAYEENIRDVISQRKYITNQDTKAGRDNYILFHLAIGNAYLRYADMLFRENQNGYMYNQKALENFEKARYLSDNKDNIRYKALVILNIGKCHRYMDDTKVAREKFKEAYKMLCERDKKKCHLDIACEAINSAAEWYRDNAKNTEAMQFYKFTIELIEKREYQTIDNLDEKKINSIERWYNKLSESVKEVRKPYFNGNLKKLQEQALLDIGIIIKRQCDIGHAMKTFKRLKEVDSENTDAVNDIGVCYRKLNLIDEAISQFESNENAKHTFFARLNLCKCYIVKDINRAEDELRNLVKEFSHKSRVHILHAQYLMEQNEYSEAIEKLDRAKSEDQYLKRHYLKIDYLTACCYKNLHQYHEAIKIYSKILGSSKTDYNRENDCACLSNMADCLAALNFYKQANEYYTRARSSFNREALEFWKEENYDEYINNLKSGTDIQQLWHMDEKHIEEKESIDHLHIEQKRVYVNNSTQKDIYADFFHNWGICLYNLYLKSEGTDSQLLESALAKFRKAQEYDSDKSISLLYEAECLKEKYRLASMDEVCDELKNEMKREYENRYDLIETSLHINDEVNSKYIVYLIDRYKHEIGGLKKATLERIKTYISNGIVYHSLQAILAIIDLCDNDPIFKGYKNDVYDNICKYKLLGEGNCALINTLLDSDDYKSIETEKKGEIFCCLIKIFEQIIRIKNECRYYSESNGSVTGNAYKTPSPNGVHYTSFDTLKLLLNTNGEKAPKFRLWNSSYMNDPEEGTMLVTKMINLYGDENRDTVKKLMTYCYPDIRNGESDVESDKSLDIIQYYNSNMYMSSLSTEDDYLSMWVHYSQGATGCSIKFDDDFFDYNYSKPHDIVLNDYDYSEFPLYNIQYLKRDELDNDELKKCIRKLYKLLAEAYDITCKDETPKNKKVYLLIRRLLDEVRFLFKDENYLYEREIRVMKSSVAPSIEYNMDTPRLYIEVNKEINIKEVRLAPKITDFRMIMPWLSECKGVQEIKKSNVKYK